MNQYIGWIPTVAGNLFFDNCRCSKNYASKKHKKYISINQTTKTDSQKYLVFSTWVDLRDEKKYEEITGLFNVILMASANTNQSELVGSVYMHRDQSTLIQQSLEKINQLERCLESIDVKYKEDKDLVGDYQTAKKLADDINCLYKVDFVVDRLGFVKLSCNSHFPKSEQEKFIVCRQAFYFIKDSTHLHKHHKTDDDSLTSIHKYEESEKLSVGIKMVNELKRGLVSSKIGLFNLPNKENSNYQKNIKLLGILAYIKSLVISCKIRKYMEPNQCANELSFLDNFASSLNCKIEEDKIESQGSKQWIDSLKSWVLFIFALITPLLLILKDKILSSANLHSGALIIGNAIEPSFITKEAVSLFSTVFLNLELLLGFYCGLLLFILFSSKVKKIIGQFLIYINKKSLLKKFNILSKVLFPLVIVAIIYLIKN